MKPAPFSRSIAIVRAAAALIAAGMSVTSALMQSGAQQYVSRGKGKGKSASKAGKQYRSSGRAYPFSSYKQDAKTERHYEIERNGHVISQTYSSAQMRPF